MAPPDEVDERVVAVCRVGLVLAGLAFGLESGPRARLERGQELLYFLGRTREAGVGGKTLGPRGEVAFRLGDAAQALLVLGRGDHALLGGPQLSEASLGGGEHPLLCIGIDRDRSGHLCRLRQRELPGAQLLFGGGKGFHWLRGGQRLAGDVL